MSLWNLNIWEKAVLCCVQWFYSNTEHGFTWLEIFNQNDMVGKWCVSSGWWCGSLSHVSRCTAWHIGVTAIHHTFSVQRGSVFSVQMEHLIITCFWAVISQCLKRWASKPSLLFTNFLINSTVSKQLFKRLVAYGKYYAELNIYFATKSCEIMSHSLLKATEQLQH